MNVLHAGGPSRERSGSALVLALFAVVTVAGLTVSLLSYGLAATREHSLRNEAERSLYLAEAGLMEAVTALRSGGTGAIGGADIPATYGAGVLWVEATALDAIHTRLTSAAACGGGRAALEVVIQEQAVTKLPGALSCAAGNLTITSDTFIDSFDSTLGSYADQLAARAPDVYVNANAKVACNGGIMVATNAGVYGDAIPGPGDSTNINGSGFVTGSTAPAAEPFAYEPITVPVFPTSGDLLVPDGTTLTLPAGDHRFNTITLGDGATLEVGGPSRIVVDGDFDLGSSGILSLGSPGQAVEVFGAGDFKWGAGCVVDTPGTDATLVALYAVAAKNQNVNLGASTKFYGTVIAPSASLGLSKDFEVFGAVGANKISLAQGALVHYDEALLLAPPGSSGSTYARSAWRQVDFPDGVLKGNTGDPFELLGTTRDQLPKPSDAHK